MKPYCLIIDNFLQNYEPVRAHLDTMPYQLEDPNNSNSLLVIDFKEDEFNISGHLERVFGQRIGIKQIMARLALEGMEPAYGIHSDADMGTQFNAIIYMTRQEYIDEHSLNGERRLGTSLLRNKLTGETTYTGDANQWGKEFDDLKWEHTLTCDMKENRCFIFPSEFLHCSRPIKCGFGNGAPNGRLVLSVFFDLMSMS